MCLVVATTYCFAKYYRVLQLQSVFICHSAISLCDPIICTQSLTFTIVLHEHLREILYESCRINTALKGPVNRLGLYVLHLPNKPDNSYRKPQRSHFANITVFPAAQMLHFEKQFSHPSPAPVQSSSSTKGCNVAHGQRCVVLSLSIGTLHYEAAPWPCSDVVFAVYYHLFVYLVSALRRTPSPRHL